MGTRVFGQAEITVLPALDRALDCGDCDGVLPLEVTGAVLLLHGLLPGGASPTSPAACDADDSGQLDITDAVRLLGYLDVAFSAKA